MASCESISQIRPTPSSSSSPASFAHAARGWRGLTPTLTVKVAAVVELIADSNVLLGRLTTEVAGGECGGGPQQARGLARPASSRPMSGRVGNGAKGAQ